MNKVVFLLPLSLMVMLFYFGYLYIISDEVITNESLQNEIIIDVSSERNGDEVALIGKWDWTAMPVDGMVGQDYITITIEEDGSQVTNENIISSTLFLLKGDTVLKEIKGSHLENGVIFTFPNELIDHESYGNRGEIEVVLKSDESIIVTFSYIHTWEEHEEISINDINNIEASVEEKLVDFWIIKRFFSLSK